MVIRVGMGALLVVTVAASAHAQVTAEQQSAIRSNCRSDFMAKCSGVTPGGKEALQCLQRNVGGLSAACKTAVSVTLPKPATASAPAAAPWPAPAASAPSSPWPATTAQPAAPTAPATASAPPPAKPAAPTAAAPKAPAKPNAAAAAKPAAPKAKTAAAPPPALAAPALTPTTEQAAAIKFTCSHDVKSFCADAAGGGPEGFACLQRNSEKLSPDCRTSVAAVEENGAVPNAEEPAVAAAGVGAMPKAPAANAVVTLRACRRDLLTHCKDVQPGGGRELACLAAHENELTVRCKMARRVSAPIR